MVRNESIGRMVMFLCFGTAILSLGVHWRITSTQGNFKPPVFKTMSSSGGIYRALGATAFGADTPPGSFTPGQVPQLKSSVSRSDNKSDTVNKNVAIGTNLPKKIQLLTPGGDQSGSVLPQQSEQRKTSNKIDVAKKEVVVVLSDRRAYVYAGDVVIASYPVAVGKKGWDTPTGTFKVNYMEHDPIWQHPITGKIFPPGPDSPLGERWIGFWSDGRNKIGFHGTPDIHLLGTAISHGCIRMRNSDVRLLYDQVEIGTPVIVKE